jgi:hypothetical protein
MEDLLEEEVVSRQFSVVSLRRERGDVAEAWRLLTWRREAVRSAELKTDN